MLSRQLLDRAAALARDRARPVVYGRVTRVAGLLIEATAPDVRLGDLLDVEGRGGNLFCEVVGFNAGSVLAVPLGPVRNVAPGALVRSRHQAAEIPVGDALLGRVIDPFGVPVDGGPDIRCRDRAPVEALAPGVSSRAQVNQRFETGIRVIDGLLTCGRGQRVGIFAGAGVGKSVLVEQIARQSAADVVVIGLIGERGREVRELLAAERRSSMVMVAATSDRSPMERVRGARAATAIAEDFCDRGANVLLIIDSLTRYAMALREIGLAIGEPPTTKGYPPSVFAHLPRLVERVAPMAHGGSITGFYTVLVEGDDLTDPIADSARSLLDAHIVLSRDMASRAHFPAVDVLASASRVARQISDESARELSRRTREVLSRRRTIEELQSLGAYVPGANAAYDHTLAIGRRIDAFSRQAATERSDFDATMGSLADALVDDPPASANGELEIK